jgi:hypothetical protein
VRINGRRKGKAGENDVGDLLEVWWSVVEPGCRFVSTPLSGGWSSPAMRGETKTAGDLVTTARRFPWTVEVKRREEWSAPAFFAGSAASPIWKWWDQVVRAAREEQREPMLWFRKNRAEWFFIVNRGRVVITSLVSCDAHPEIVCAPALDLLDLDPRELAL